MGHAESPSLIPLGLAADVSQEGSSFRWGIIASCFLHILVVVMAVFLRFQSTTEEPFRTMDVALVSLPEMQTAAPSKEKASRPTPTPAKVQPASPPKAQTREESLPPLPIPIGFRAIIGIPGRCHWFNCGAQQTGNGSSTNTYRDYRAKSPERPVALV